METCAVDCYRRKQSGAAGSNGMPLLAQAAKLKACLYRDLNKALVICLFHRLAQGGDLTSLLPRASGEERRFGTSPAAAAPAGRADIRAVCPPFRSAAAPPPPTASASGPTSASLIVSQFCSAFPAWCAA